MNSRDISEHLPENKHSIFDPEYYGAARDLLYKNHIDVLDDIRMWAIELFRRIYKQVEKNAHELMIVSVLFKQAIVSFDAAIVCLENCAINAALLHTRSLLEARLYLEWVLHSDNDKEYLGRQIYVSTKRHEMRMLKRMIPGTAEYKLHKNSWEDSGRKFTEPTDEEIERAKEVVGRIGILLQLESYLEINQSFEKHSKSHEVPWYIPGKYGVRSIFKLAEKLKRLPEYLNIYSTTSLYTHGTVSFIHASFLPDSKHQVEPIRTIEGISNIIDLISNDMYFVIDMMVREYREGELPTFKKAHESWKPRLENLPKFEIRIDENLI